MWFYKHIQRNSPQFSCKCLHEMSNAECLKIDATKRLTNRPCCKVYANTPTCHIK